MNNDEISKADISLEFEDINTLNTGEKNNNFNLDLDNELDQEECNFFFF